MLVVVILKFDNVREKRSVPLSRYLHVLEILASQPLENRRSMLISKAFHTQYCTEFREEGSLFYFQFLLVHKKAFRNLVKYWCLA